MTAAFAVGDRVRVVQRGRGRGRHNRRSVGTVVAVGEYRGQPTGVVVVAWDRGPRSAVDGGDIEAADE